MAFKGSTAFNHQQPDKIGILLVNLGTPDAPTASALRRYLAEFLGDRRVVEIPRLLWWLILHGIILRLRPRKSAKKYASIWQEQGSPLLVHSVAQRNKLRERLDSNHLVELGMRYGNPSITSALDNLLENGAHKVLVLPLYPQYCGATTASTFEAIADDFRQRRWLPEFRFISHYHDFPPYIDACVAAIKQSWQQHGRAEKLLLSYHGVPKFYLEKGDPYFCECQKTSRLIAERLGLKDNELLTTFQSRFGKAEWLQPYTDKTLHALGSSSGEDSTRSVDVFCPGFAADCLETLEEIADENRTVFREAGGKVFRYIPALNANSEHISALMALLNKHLQGWQPTAFNHEQSIKREQRAQRAKNQQ